MTKVRAFGRRVWHTLDSYTESGVALTRCQRVLYDPTEQEPNTSTQTRDCRQCEAAR